MFALLLNQKGEVTLAKQRLKDKADELGIRLGRCTEKADKLISAICNVPNIDTLTALVEEENKPHTHTFHSQNGLAVLGFNPSSIVMPEPRELKDGKNYPIERLNEESLKSLEVNEKPLTASANDLTNLMPRTLLYGYDCERHTCHLYLDDNSLLNYIVYKRRTKTIIKYKQGVELEVNSIIPPKRTYPHKSCREFAELIFSLGKRISFCGYKEVEPKVFYGYKKEECFSQQCLPVKNDP